MNVGLFGGSFNPPHIAHLIVAETIREEFGLGEVWWIPAHLPPHKTDAAELVPAAHRLEMTRRAIRAHPAFRICEEEVERGGTSYTADTLRVLQERHPDLRFALILGSDSLAGFSSWHQPGKIVERAELLVYRRPGPDADDGLLAELPPRIARRVRIADDVPLLHISSTNLRARRRQGRSLRYLVPEPVRTYIEAHDLYTAPRSSVVE